MTTRNLVSSHRAARRVGVAIIGAGVLLASSEAAAEVVINGLSQESSCMQKVFGWPVTNSNKLNCTANDIRISQAVAVEPSTCIKGTKFDLKATFEVNVTANSRYDAGFFFRTDGGLSARGDDKTAAGTCSLSSLDPGILPANQLDGDTCGDMNAGVKTVTFLIPDVSCEAAQGTNVLRLPNCTSWHSSVGTACASGKTADFHPDTKSKCVCDDQFTVPVTVEEASISVTKEASVTSVPESEDGTLVTYKVTVTNDSMVESVTISSISDLIGNLAVPDDKNNVTIDLSGDSLPLQANDCDSLIGQSLDPGKSLECSFALLVNGDPGTSVDDEVEVCATQQDLAGERCAHGDASVGISDQYTEPSLMKTVKSTSDCQLKAVYQVEVFNHSTYDELTVDSLVDDRFGDITGTHPANEYFNIEEVFSTTCVMPVPPIAPLGSYKCEFTGVVRSPTCTFDHTNTVTGYVTDDDGVEFEPSDDAKLSVVTSK